MKNYLKHDPWKIIEEGFNPAYNCISESVFSLGNGKMGQRANFEEGYSGETLAGSYVAGIYYPDKTRVGWWKNGYPEYFAKVLNATNWIGIGIEVNGEKLDLDSAKVEGFRRELNMREGYLYRSFTATLANGNKIAVEAKRFCSMVDNTAGAIKYTIRSIGFAGMVRFTPYLDADVVNQDSNYGEKFWEELGQGIDGEVAWVNVRTKKTGFDLCTAMMVEVKRNGEAENINWEDSSREKFVSKSAEISISDGEALSIFKYASNITSEDYVREEMKAKCKSIVEGVAEKGFAKMLEEQAAAWKLKWDHSDVAIAGDVAAQQGIRFNIFQLHQTYTGEDERLNIGPKGFTGEKYGGSTYWDTEAYCLPFYLSTAEQKVSRNLLRYRYKHLQKAIENAEKLGFSDGAALYPMVTMNGEECHNEWEITFEEIHRNGAIAYAIFDYIRYTGDESYLAEFGLEVLIALARFWSQRTNWSGVKQQYVILGVTGPNEYENNVNNNWYTNKCATWTLSYALESLEGVKENAPQRFEEILEKTGFKEEEVKKWRHIIDHMYYPEEEELGIFLQQEGYMDKDQTLVADLDPKHLPINQKWSWDRILRSPYIKQADVLQGMYFFEDEFDMDTHKRNYEFYEPRTVHESSLSPCVHSILAAKIGRPEKAYEMYLRTARLDLDDYNNDTEDGCHITSMAGSWMSIVKGFAAMRVRNNQLRCDPFIPDQWQAYSFKLGWRGHLLQVKVAREGVEVRNETETDIEMMIYGESRIISGNANLIFPVREVGNLA